MNDDLHLAEVLRRLADDLVKLDRTFRFTGTTHSVGCWQWHDVCALHRAAEQLDAAGDEEPTDRHIEQNGPSWPTTSTDSQSARSAKNRGTAPASTAMAAATTSGVGSVGSRWGTLDGGGSESSEATEPTDRCPPDCVGVWEQVQYESGEWSRELEPCPHVRHDRSEGPQ